jgi:hypothetical protein
VLCIIPVYEVVQVCGEKRRLMANGPERSGFPFTVRISVLDLIWVTGCPKLGLLGISVLTWVLSSTYGS